MEPIKSLDEVEICASESLGSGYIAHVKKARHRTTGALYAVKIAEQIDTSRISPEEQVAIRREVRIQKTLNHPNIVRLVTSFERDGHLYILMELLQRSLFQFINSVQFDESLFLRFFYEIAKAIFYIHAKKIVHRDIKPENILLTEHLTVKLCDFGFCAPVETEVRRTKCGTVEYLPPEIIRGESQTDRVDIWCLGVLLYEMWHRRTPFPSRNFDQMLEMIRKKEVKFDAKINPAVRELILSCLQEDPASRPSARQIIDNPLFEKYKPIIRTNSVLNAPSKAQEEAGSRGRFQVKGLEPEAPGPLRAGIRTPTGEAVNGTGRISPETGTVLNQSQGPGQTKRALGFHSRRSPSPGKSNLPDKAMGKVVEGHPFPFYATQPRVLHSAKNEPQITIQTPKETQAVQPSEWRNPRVHAAPLPTRSASSNVQPRATDPSGMVSKTFTYVSAALPALATLPRRDASPSGAEYRSARVYLNQPAKVEGDWATLSQTSLPCSPSELKVLTHTYQPSSGKEVKYVSTASTLDPSALQRPYRTTYRSPKDQEVPKGYHIYSEKPSLKKPMLPITATPSNKNLRTNYDGPSPPSNSSKTVSFVNAVMSGPPPTAKPHTPPDSSPRR